MPDFARGDRVRLTKDCRDFTHGDEVFKAGEEGKLGRRYRIQDGIQVWEVVLDKKYQVGVIVAGVPIRICTGHTSFEKC